MNAIVNIFVAIAITTLLSRSDSVLAISHPATAFGSKTTDAYHARAPILGVGRPQENGTRAPGNASVSYPLGKSFVEPGLQRVKQNPGLLHAAIACPKKPFFPSNSTTTLMHILVSVNLCHTDQSASLKRMFQFPRKFYPFWQINSWNSASPIKSHQIKSLSGYRTELRAPETSIHHTTGMNAPPPATQNPIASAAASLGPSHKPLRSLRTHSLQAALGVAPSGPSAGSPAAVAVPESFTLLSSNGDVTAEDFTINIEEAMAIMNTARNMPESTAAQSESRAAAMLAAHEFVCFTEKNTSANAVAPKLQDLLRAHVTAFLTLLATSTDPTASELGTKFFIEEGGTRRINPALNLTVEVKPSPQKTQVLFVSVSASEAIANAWPMLRFGISLFDPTQINIGVERCVLTNDFIKLFAPCMSIYSLPKATRMHRNFAPQLISSWAKTTLKQLVLFVATRSEHFLVVLSAEPEKLVTSPLVLVLDETTKIQQFPILPTPHDRHVYFAYADLHFPGRSIETTPTKQLLERYASLFSTLNTPASHAVAVGHSVIRVHFESPEHKNKILAYKENPTAKPGVITIRGAGPLVVLSQMDWTKRSSAYFKQRQTALQQKTAVQQNGKRVRSNGDMAT